MVSLLGPIIRIGVLIGALSTLPRKVFSVRLLEGIVPEAPTYSYTRDYVNLNHALQCLNPDEKILDVIAREVSAMRRHAQAGELERIPGPRVVRAPLAHSFVALGDKLGQNSDRNCIERAEPIVALEADVAELSTAARVLKNIEGAVTVYSDPHFLIEEPVHQSLCNSLDLVQLSTFRNEDAKATFKSLRKILDTYSKLPSKTSARDFYVEMLRVKAVLTLATTKAEGALKLARQFSFPESSSCTPFSQASIRLARFSSCLSISELVPKFDDNKIMLMKDWDSGVYIRKNFSWALVSRAAAKALKFPKSWHSHVLDLLHTPDSQKAEVIAKCAVQLLPSDMAKSVHAESSWSQEHQALTLRCLPALLNSPGFQGTLLEEKDRVYLSDSFIVEKQCVTPPVCGRLGAAVLTAFQGRHYGGLGSRLSALENWTFETRAGQSELVLGDCMDIASTKSFGSYDYSHVCFPQIMRYLCHALPSCCPSLGTAPTCSSLSAEQFARNNTPCDTCRESFHFKGDQRGGSTALWSTRPFFGEAASDNEIRQLFKE